MTHLSPKKNVHKSTPWRIVSERQPGERHQQPVATAWSLVWTRRYRQEQAFPFYLYFAFGAQWRGSTHDSHRARRGNGKCLDSHISSQLTSGHAHPTHAARHACVPPLTLSTLYTVDSSLLVSSKPFTGRNAGQKSPAAGAPLRLPLARLTPFFSQL